MTTSFGNAASRRAPALLDATAALRRELGFAPCCTSEEAGWDRVSLRRWQGARDHCTYQPFGELLIVLQSGGRRWRVEADGHWLEGQSTPGCVTVVPPGTPLQFEVDGGVDGWTLHLPPQRWHNLTDHDDDPPVPHFPFAFASRDALLTGALQALIQELCAPVERGPLLADRLADALVLHLMSDRGTHAPRGGLSPRSLARTLECIEESLAGGVALDELARVACLSRSHFTAGFRRSTGRSPQEYLRHRRVERAKALLRDGDRPIADVAIAVGFASQAHFGACFKAATGTTPWRFRRSRGP